MYFIISKIKAWRWDILFVCRAVIVGIITVLVWLIMRECGLSFKKESEGLVTTGVLVAIGLIYGLVAGKALESTWDDQKKMAAAIIERNLLKYLVCRDERIPVVLHIFLGATSILFVGFIMILHYEETVCGILSVWTVSFIVSLLFLVIEKLDDPRGSPWFKSKTPSGWDTVTVDDYWKEKEAEKKLHLVTA